MWKNLKRLKQACATRINPSLNTRIVWSLLGVFILADAAALKATGISLAPHALLPNMLAVSFLLFLTVVYTYFRKRPRIAEMTHMSAVFFVFTASMAICSYLTVAWQRPLIDDYLVAADHALGLDWLASYKWVIGHPLIRKALYVAYSTLVPQIVLLLLVLNFRGRCARGWEMMWLFMVSCMICLVFSAFWPAAGAFGYYHVETDRAYVHVFMALHNGTLRTIGDTPIQGIIQFPSFHVGLAILLTYIARGMWVLFLFLLEINILLLLSTAPIGGHHFADLWGGIALALVTIMAVRAAFAAGLMPDTEKIEDM